MKDHQYFTTESTACTIPKRGALAIYCGDAPRKNDDGTTSRSLRGPLLLMPPDMWSDGEKTGALVAQVLNENAHRFFPAAPTPDAYPMRGGVWMPIETAPKDGAWVLVWSAEEGVEMRLWHEGRGAFTGWHDAYSVREDPCKDNTVNPTHWMPLPAPPARSNGEG